MANILIIDDERIILQQLSKLVASFGHTPTHTTYPNYLFQILESKSIHLILMDVYMPGIDGVNLLKQLKAHPTHNAIPVIMSTGDTDDKLLLECFEAGAMDFINKPFNEVVLRARIQSALNTQEFIAQLKESREKAEEATKLKDKFVSLMAHDLKAPFTSILGFLSVMQEDQEPSLHEKHKKMLDRVIDNGKGLIKMVDKLLTISMLQTGKIVPQKKFLDVFQTSASVIGNLSYLAREKEIELINEVPRATRIFADFDLMGEVVSNLVSNSIKFCHKGDHIRIFVPTGSTATIAVEDTGIGISEKLLPIIFKHEEVTTKKGTAGEKGTGLGLPLCNDIMEAHEGTLRVESVEGKGSTFYAQLPERKPLVAIIDDDDFSRLWLKENMLQIGSDVVEALDGEEGINLLGDTTPDLILLDLSLPVMTGFEVLERIRENPLTKLVPVIIITSSTDIQDRERVLQMGANDFATKPLHVVDFIPRVKRFVI